MKYFLSSFLVLLSLQNAVAQRAYNMPAGPYTIAMTKVQGGYFDMGSDDPGEATDRKPAHTVKLRDFNISTYEITQDQWEEVMDCNPAYYAHCGDCPVTNVSWNDVQTFIKKLNEMKGRHFRLPTEAEWEYAARGGRYEKQLLKEQKGPRGGVNGLFLSEDEEGLRKQVKYKKGMKYAGRNEAQPVAWYTENAKDHVHPVGRKQPNLLGIYDMSGNAEEWISDWYAKGFGSRDTVENPTGPISGVSHVVRGGGWSSTLEELVVTNRKGYLPKTKTNYLGFRLVEDME